MIHVLHVGKRIIYYINNQLVLNKIVVWIVGSIWYFKNIYSLLKVMYYFILIELGISTAFLHLMKNGY